MFTKEFKIRSLALGISTVMMMTMFSGCTNQGADIKNADAAKQTGSETLVNADKEKSPSAKSETAKKEAVTEEAKASKADESKPSDEVKKDSTDSKPKAQGSKQTKKGRTAKTKKTAAAKPAPAPAPAPTQAPTQATTQNPAEIYRRWGTLDQMEADCAQYAKDCGLNYRWDWKSIDYEGGYCNATANRGFYSEQQYKDEILGAIRSYKDSGAKNIRCFFVTSKNWNDGRLGGDAGWLSEEYHFSTMDDDECLVFFVH